MLPIHLVALAVLSGASRPPEQRDTLVIRTAAVPPVLDGAASRDEYGASTLTLPLPGGEAEVWVVRHDGWVYVAARLPDSTFYWGDDLVVAVDPDGSGGTAPGPGDRRWVVRRTADSSVVTSAGNGRWEPAGGARPIGSTRQGPGWELRTREGRRDWTAELRLDEGLFQHSGKRLPTVALRAFDDQPRPTWGAWPPPPSDMPPSRQERIPELWAPAVLRAAAVEAPRRTRAR